MSGEFLDTNVLVYAHDTSAGTKRDRASELVVRLAEDGTGLLSTQVMMEFFVTVTRKIPYPVAPEAAGEILQDLGTWPVFSPGVPEVLEAVRIASTYRIHFWDAMIVCAAAGLKASVIWTEDFNDGQSYEGILAKNPFLQ